MTTKAVSSPAPVITPAKAWLMAIRVPTLPAAVVPVLVGVATGYMLGSVQWLPSLAALLAAILIQIGTNLANDYFDAQKGADTADRLGPVRVTQSGLISPSAVRNAMILAFALAAALGVYLIIVGGWPILLIGLLSIAAGILYTGGPLPYGYHGLGDLFTFIFFGPVAVVGTAYLNTGRFEWSALAFSVPVGMLVTAILVVNNLRDAPTDKQAGKRTLAVIYGEMFARTEYALLLIGAYLILPILWTFGAGSPWLLLAMLSAPLATNEMEIVAKRSGRVLSKALAGTARLHLVFGLLMALGIALSRR